MKFEIKKSNVNVKTGNENAKIVFCAHLREKSIDFI